MAPRARSARPADDPAPTPEKRPDATSSPAAPDEAPGIEDAPDPTDIRGTDAEPALRDDDAVRVPEAQADARPWDTDPFELLRAQEARRAPASYVDRQAPGTRSPLPDEKLARDGLVEYADDALVHVKLWEVDSAGVAGDPIMYVENVLYSTAKNPLLWIAYRGWWHMEIIQQGTGKRLVKKSFKTRGPKPPDDWRPTIAKGDDMDRTALVSELINLGIIRPGQTQSQGFPSGAVPNQVYGDVQGQIGKLEAKIERLEADRNAAVQAKNDAERKHDLKESELRAADKEIRRLEGAITELKADLKEAPRKGDGTPEWVSIVQALKPTDQLTAKDLLGFMKRDREDGGSDKFGDLNAALDFVEKARKAAGIAGAGGGGENTLKDIVGLLGKAGDIIKGNQRLEEIERARRPPPAHQAPAQPPPAAAAPTEADEDKAALERTINKVMDSFRGKLDPVAVGRRLAAACIWARELDMTSSDPQVAGFMGGLTSNPEDALTWFGSVQKPPIDEAYCLEVSKTFRGAMNMKPLDPPAPTKSAATDAQATLPQPPAQQPGGGDGAASPQPPSAPAEVAPAVPKPN